MSDLSRLSTNLTTASSNSSSSNNNNNNNYTNNSSSPVPPPPPPPPLHQQTSQKYSHRAANALARFAQPFLSASRPPSPQASSGAGRTDPVGPRHTRSRSLPGASQTVTHKTGIPISALDISPQRTHAVIGGKEILKTIRVSPDHSSEEFNLRNAIISYSSTHYRGSALSVRHKDQLAVKDVKWSHGNYDRMIATAIASGRIVIYDLHRTGLEFCRFQGHSRQVHRLAFNPHFPAWLLSGSQDSSIRMWDLRMASAERGVSACGSKDLYNGNSDAIRDIRWSPSDGVMFATATDSGAVQLWDYRKVNAPLMRITAHDRSCFSVDWHPDGKHIVTGGTDRQVKVWDFSSSAERRQKPTFQFRTPQAVTNARWRPPSWTKESLQDSGGWQSVQVVTSYDKEDPRVHLWDLQRPHIPFREFDRYDSHAADLLWHSKDLLWTVGDAGAFTQTDVRYAPQVVNRRPTGSIAWSPNGDVLAFVQKRPRRSPLGLTTSEFLGYQADESTIAEPGLSQSPSDDILDEPSFTSAIRHRHTKSVGARPSKSLGSTPPSAPDFVPVVPLERGRAPGPQQLGAVGSIPGATMDPALFRYLTRQYSALMGSGDDKQARSDLLPSLLESFDHNAKCAEAASLFQLAQTWRIVKFAVLQELQFKAREQRRSPEKTVGGIKKKLSKEGPLGEKNRPLDEGKPDKMKNRLFKGVLETEGHRNLLSDNESSSNLATPLARPLPDSPIGSDGSGTSNGDMDDIQPLPPSVLSSNQTTTDSSSWSDMGVPTTAQSPHRQSTSSDHASSTSFLSEIQGSVAPEFPVDQRSAPRAITGRADWRLQNGPESSKQASEEDEYDQKMEGKRAAIRDYKQFPKKVLSLESPLESKPAGFQRHESTESFPMFSASTEGSHPSKAAGASFSPTSRVYDIAEIGEHGEEATTNGGTAIDHNPTRARGDSLVEAESGQDREAVPDDIRFEESLPDDRIHLDRPSSPPTLLTKSNPLKMSGQEGGAQTVNGAATSEESARLSIPGINEDISGIPLPIRSAATENKPWSVEVLMRESIRHYHSGSIHVDIQSSAHLLQKLHVLFRDCEQILPYEECETIFKIDNEHLLRQSMYLEAAELRLLCVPSYPVVYDYAQMDTFINVYCFRCKRPYENPKQDNRRCHRCDTPQDPCAICMSIDPPPEWVAEQSVPSVRLNNNEEDLEATSHLMSSRSSVRTEPVPPSELQHLDNAYLDSFTAPRPKGSALWTWCQGCGHGGHMACITTWLSDVSMSEGGCATPGCMHDCGPGQRREENRITLAEESRRRDSAGRRAGAGFAKRDPWARAESRAVEKVRGMLGVPASGIPTNPTNGSSGGASQGMVSPKKVRLVTPSEQGSKRRVGLTRASTGGGIGQGGRDTMI